MTMQVIPIMSSVSRLDIYSNVVICG